MVGSDGVDDFRLQVKFLSDVFADFRMRALHFVVNRFADVVQEAGFFSNRYVSAELVGQ